MEIIDVLSSEREVGIKDPFRITFSIIGAKPYIKPFVFPFSNESLTENKIIFKEV